MAKFRLFAGLSGGFGGAQDQGVFEFPSAKEAEQEAYDIAWDIYESYAGSNGILSWDEVYEDCLASEFIEPGAQSEAEIEIEVDKYYVEAVESRIEWRAEEVNS